MRKIDKKEEPSFFTDWKEKYPRAVYNDLNKKQHLQIKIELRDTLLREQKGLCCYCGINLKDINSHIEHVIPQSSKSKTLAYDNIHLSCNGDNPDLIGEGKDELKYCGMAKKDKYIPITPLTSNCEERFKYLEDGGIIPTLDGDSEAIETINTLRLNGYVLQKMREVLVDELLMPILIEDNKNELQGLYDFYSSEHEDGLASFSFVFQQIIKRYMA